MDGNERGNKKHDFMRGRKNKMPPHEKCRVCGAPAPGFMPCRRCLNLLLQRDNVNMPVKLRAKSNAELERILKEVTG